MEDILLSLITNKEALIANTYSQVNAEARRIALTLLETAISAVDPMELIKTQIHVNGNTLTVGPYTLNLTKYKEILVLGGGKASGAMAEMVERILGDRITAGFINIPENSAQKYQVSTIQLNEAGHPIPNEAGEQGVDQIFQYLKGVTEETLILFLLSGGGSALLPSPQDGITLTEKKQITNLLLRSGATINDINVVRKHISKIKGGRLAVASFPATLLCLVLSDVLGDPLPSIASGPTVPDPSTYQDAIQILHRYAIWNDTPFSVQQFLLNGQEGKNTESPKAGDSRFAHVRNILLGNNSLALAAAERQALTMKLNPLILSSYIQGEARHVGTVLASIAREITEANKPIPQPGVVLAGGETTVTVTGTGQGGRNGEVALSASLALEDLEGVVIASLGTDGIDGLSDAAGAIVDASTLKKARTKNLSPLQYLQNNDSHHYFKELGDLVYTGPTGTNVNDVMIIVNLPDLLKEGEAC